jgi:hypothetical protein
MAEVGDLFRDASFTVPIAKAPWAITGTFGFQRPMVCRLVIQDEPEDLLGSWNTKIQEGKA